MPNDYHPLSPTNDPTHKEDTLPICDSKMKQALDPNYFLPNCLPKQGEDAPTLVNNLIATPAKTKEEEEDQREHTKEENKG